MLTVEQLPIVKPLGRVQDRVDEHVAFISLPCLARPLPLKHHAKMLAIRQPISAAKLVHVMLS